MDSVKNKLGYFEINNDAYLVASHIPLEFDKPVKFKREFKWGMIEMANNSKKRSLNIPGNTIYFIGKEIAGNGVNYCMGYAKEIAGFLSEK